MSKKGSIIFSIIVLFAACSTALLILRILGITLFEGSTLDHLVIPSEYYALILYGANLENSSYIIAPVSWLLVGTGLWIWRGRTRALFQNAGFDKDVFKLLLRTKGGNSRTELLKALLTPKDRMQLSKELGIDWKAIDRHLKVLQKFGLIQEEADMKANRKRFVITKIGQMLLNVLEEMKELEKEQDQCNGT